MLLLKSAGPFCKKRRGFIVEKIGKIPDHLQTGTLHFSIRTQLCEYAIRVSQYNQNNGDFSFDIFTMSFPNVVRVSIVFVI